jgi:hypothetical protein
MADEGTPTPTTAPTTEPPAPTTGITQEEVSRIAAREKDQGRRAAENAIAEKLGVSVEEAAEIVKAARAAADAERTEVERAKGAEATAKAAAKAAEDALARTQHERKIELELIEQGVPVKAAAKVVALVDSEVGSDEAAVAASVAALKAEMPAVFTAAEEPELGPDGKPVPAKPKPPASDPKGTPPKPTAGEDAFSRGAERAKSHGGGRSAYSFETAETQQ